MIDDLAEALNRAIATQARTHIARVTAVGLRDRGVISAYSELLGPIEVTARTSDALGVGDYIQVRRAGPEKYGKYLYAGYGGGTVGENPGIAPDIRIYINNPQDGSGTTVPSAAGTLQYYLDLIVQHLRSIQGTALWTDLVPPTSLLELVTWRGPVAAESNLPLSGNRLGDVRITLDTGTLFVWGSDGWHAIGGGGGGVSTSAITTLTLGPQSVEAFTLLAMLSSGAVPASATEITHFGRVVGMALVAAGPVQPVLTQTSGTIMFSETPALQGRVFLGENGALATTCVTGAVFVQPVGVLVGSRLFLTIDPAPIALSPLPDTGGGSTMAFTWTPITQWVEAYEWTNPDHVAWTYTTYTSVIGLNTPATPATTYSSFHVMEGGLGTPGDLCTDVPSPAYPALFPPPPIGYGKDAAGIVHLRGSLCGVAETGHVNNGFLLPVGFRPEFTSYFLIASSWPSAKATIRICPDGWVTFDTHDAYLSTDVVWYYIYEFYLDSISFVASA